MLFTLFAFAAYILYNDSDFSDEAAVFFHLNYSGGWIPAGFAGSCFLLLCRMFSLSAVGWNGMLVLFQVLCIFETVLILLLALILLIRIQEKKEPEAGRLTMLLFFFLIFELTMFHNSDSFASVFFCENILLLLSLISLCFLHLRWLTIPWTVIGILTAPDYILQCFPVIFVVLLLLPAQDSAACGPRFAARKKPYLAFLNLAAAIVTWILSELSFQRLGDGGKALVQTAARAAAVQVRPSAADPAVTETVRSYLTLFSFHMPTSGEAVRLLVTVLCFLPFFIAAGFFSHLLWKNQKRSAYLLLLPPILCLLSFFDGSFGADCFFLCTGWIGSILLPAVLGAQEIKRSFFSFADSVTERFPAAPFFLLLWPMLFLPFSGSDTVCRTADAIASLIGRIV